jgi:hypothetical protein
VDVDLFDSMTRAVPHLKACCVKSLNSATNVVDPEKRKPLAVRAEGGALVLELTCPVCKTLSVIRADRGQVQVEARPSSG